MKPKTHKLILLLIVIINFLNVISSSNIEPMLTNIPIQQHPTYDWKFDQNFDKEFPDMPYQTNGQGPAFNQNDARFSEFNQTEPPHPDMPDEHPKVLMEMQQKLDQAMGIPKPDVPQEFQNGYQNEDMEDGNNGLQQEIQQQLQPRFSQVEDKEKDKIQDQTKLEAKDKSKFWWGSRLHKPWEAVKFVKGWASSVYTFRWWWWWHSYPATNAFRGWSYWCSTGGHSKDQVVTWQGDLERVRRINHLYVHWAYAPGEYSVQVSPDGKVWEEKVEWKKGARSWLSNWWYKIFWWWKWWYRSYAENISFDEPVFANGFRILMKDNIFYYYGIYRVYAWSKQYTMQLKNGASNDVDYCLTTASGNYFNGAKIVSESCIDDIANLDAREVFILQNNLQITTYIRGLCIETYGGKSDENAVVNLWTCWRGGSWHQKWLLDHKGYMKFMANQEMCLTVTGQETEIQHECINTASASSTMNDGQHEAKLAVNGNEENHWASAPGEKTANFQVTFGTQTVKSIEVDFQYVSTEFDVQILIDGSWRSQELIQSNEKKEVTIDVAAKSISGVKLLLLKTNGEFDGKPIYGIKQLKIKSGSRPVGLRKCTDDSGGQNKWYIDDVNWVDVSVPPRVRYEWRILYQYTNRLLDLLNILITWPNKIVKMLEKGKEMKIRIEKVEEELNDMDIKMNVYRSENLQKEEDEAKAALAGTIGSNSQHPARSCAIIKRTYPYKKTGYYWIQPECAKVPLRVFCDFTSDTYGISYAYYGGLANGQDLNGKVKSLDDARYECSKLGLYPVQVNSVRQLDMIFRYMMDIGVYVQGKAIVPMGYDYGCDNGQCSEHYHSLNTADSPDMTDVFKGKTDSKNIFQKVWAKLFNTRKDEAIGFGMSKKGMTTFKMDGNLPVKGLICSTNSNDQEFEHSWVVATCDTAVRGNTDFDGIENTNIKVKCPAGCLNKGSTKVYGIEIFKDDSSICKAAIHNKRIAPEEGGYIEVGIEQGQQSYGGSESNGIKSDEYSNSWDRSFVVNTFEWPCPINNYKQRTNSFLEVNEMIDNQEHLRDDPNSQNSQQQQSQDSGSDQGGAKGEEGGDSGDKIESTADAISKLEELFTTEKDSLKKQIRIVQDATNLNKQVNAQYHPLITTDIGPDYQANYLNTLEMHIIGSNNEMTKLLAEAKEKLRRKIIKKKKMIMEKMELLQFEPYKEDYYVDLQMMYDIQSFKSAYNGPAKWEFTKQNIKSHANAIGQTSNIQVSGGYNSEHASHLILNYKRYYDAKIRVSVLPRDAGSFGIAFRYIDQFNHYVFDMQNGENGFKRLRKFVNGQSTTINIIKDGGFLEDEWYRVIIEYKLGSFKVWMEQESPDNLLVENEEKMKMVISGYDYDIAMGGVAFTVNSMAGVYFDHFSTEPYDCAKQDDIQDTTNYLAPKCNRFKESFLTAFEDIWNVEDPDDDKEGPSSWTYQKSFEGKDDVIMQNSIIYSGGEDKVPTILELKLEKVCNLGVIQLQFLAKTHGVVGIGFHHKNSKNHYTFEIGGQLAKFCTVRKIINGSYRKLERQDDTCGYEVGVWYQVVISLFTDKIVIYMAKEGEGLTEVMRADFDQDFKNGKISLSTFRTQAAFTDILMLPSEDVDIKIKKPNGKNGKLEVDELDNNNNGGGNNGDDDDDDNNGVRPQKPHQENDKDEPSLCLEKKTPVDREKYCKEKFPDKIAAYEDCQENFCPRCCDKLVDSLHPLAKFKCNKDCQENTQQDKTDESWKLCIQTPRPPLSVYQYCETSMKQQYDKTRCKIDFCHLCCVTADEVFHAKFADSSIKKCHDECMENYMEEEDVSI